MTTFLHFLGNLTALDWTFIGVAWLHVDAALGTFTGRGIKHADDTENWTDWTLDQPRVPTQADVDACWLDAWPVGNDDETRLRFDQIVSAEEWAS